MSAPNMKSVAEKELPRVKIIYDTCGDGVAVYVFRPNETPVKDGWGDAEFDSSEKAEAWVARQKFKVVEVAYD